ncbi:MAG: YHYH protein [Verrucomicrobia bacterium]|nr:YHYH protein [Verrucomicrobiota bacterium]
MVTSFMGRHLAGGWFLVLALSWARAHPGHGEGDLETAAGGLPESKVSMTEEGSFRVIRANGIPNHATGRFPGPGCPNAISAQRYQFRVPLHPQTNAAFTPIKQQAIGVALNGVPFDPGTAEYWKNDRNSGWHIEAIGGGKSLGLDQNQAHVQPSGAYHYHGVPTGLLAKLGEKDPALIGYAADGFPIYAESSGNRSSYRLKSGNRPGGTAGPGGAYDGTYTADYEYVNGLGDLDEANGRTGVTPEYPQGTYHYVATSEFPFFPRMLKGTPDASFRRGPPGGGPQGERQNPGAGKGGQNARTGRGDVIQRFDQNGDGKISQVEAPPPMQKNFSRHDANGDGFIDAEEAKSLPQPGQGRPQGPPEN